MRRGKLLFTFIILILLGCFSLAWGADRGPIRSGETKSGFQLAGPSFIDTWTFNGNAGDRVLIGAEPTSGSTRVFISLYPPDSGPREAYGEQALDHQLRQTGLYTMVIEEYGRDAESTYDLTLLKIPGAISSPGDPDGGAIASGETLAPAGELSISDQDAFQFYGNADDRVLIGAEPTSGSTRVFISLYPPDSGPREAYGEQALDHQLRQTGLYTMVIEEYGRDAESTYDLTLLKIPGAISSPGDPDGGAIASGETLAPAGELSISDQDAFQFYGNADDRVLIGAEPTSGSTRVFISLYPPDSGPREAYGEQALDHQLRQTGLYTMVIEEYGRDAESTYDLTLLKIPGAISSPGDPDGGAIASGETLAPAGELSISDQDAFQFYGNADDRVLIGAEPTSGSTRVFISLYPPDSGPREAYGEQALDHQLRQTGLYTMVIEEYGRDAESTYDLTLLKIPGAISSPGDPDGGAIASGETLAPAGELSISDQDAFQFYGNADDRVLIGAEPTSGSTRVFISLYPPDSGPREAYGEQALDHQLRQTGLYTMVIEEYGRDAESIYNLSLAKIPPQLRPGLYNPFPANGAIISDLSDFFSWDPVPGATGYDVYFGENVIVPLPRIRNNISSPSTRFPAMDPDKIYYWHVVAHTSGGDIEGPYWWFETVEVCYIDYNLNIDNQILSTTETFEACNTITAGPAVTVTATGNVLFQAGRRVILRPGFSVEDGGRLSVVIDPSTGSLP